MFTYTVGICVATDTEPVSSVAREYQFALCVNSVLEFAVYVNVSFAFFFVPNTDYMVVCLRFGHDTTGSPNPIAATCCGNVGKESYFVLASRIVVDS